MAKRVGLGKTYSNNQVLSYLFRTCILVGPVRCKGEHECMGDPDPYLWVYILSKLKPRFVSDKVQVTRICYGTGRIFVSKYKLF